jgi:hypothetical protein
MTWRRVVPKVDTVVEAQPEIRRRRSKRVEVDRGSMDVDMNRKVITV